MLSLEAHKLGQRAEAYEAYKLVLAAFQGRPINELRTLGKLLREEDDVIAVLAAYDGQKLSLIVSCADNTGVSAKELLAKQLGQIDGKGGGDAKIAQGGGQATESQIEIFFDNTRDYILAL
jgi:alanyl-tRNA synthetase